MKKIKMLVELQYDDKIMHGKNKDETNWFYKEILQSKTKGELILHSNEIGDEVGLIKVLKII